MSIHDQQRRRLGARIRAAREAAGFTQAEVAERIELSVESVSRAERGAITPTIWSMVAFADALAVDLNDLARGTERRPRERRRPAVERLIRIISGLDDESVGLLGDLLRSVLRKRA